jgi:hypothetical protein
VELRIDVLEHVLGVLGDGTFERYFIRAPAGMMWSVVILSPTLMATSPVTDSGKRSFFGGAPMFGPREIWTACGWAAGAITIESSAMNLAGSERAGHSSFASRGSVTTPVSAATAAVSGLTRYTFALLVPERFRKLRLEVRSETESV